MREILSGNRPPSESIVTEHTYMIIQSWQLARNCVKWLIVGWKLALNTNGRAMLDLFDVNIVKGHALGKWGRVPVARADLGIYEN